MQSEASSFSRHFMIILLLQMTALASGQFTVHSSASHQVVTLGTQAEFSCQLSPAQSAQHMEVGWFWEQYSQPIHLHGNGDQHSGESTQNSTNRTVFLKDALGQGKVTLRIYDVSVFDGGLYHCFFKDGDTYEEATMDLRVAAVGLDIQMNIQFPDEEGLLVECSSGGWFPQAEIMWRDSDGNIIANSSKYYSQDGAGLLHLKTSAILTNSTHGLVTCCIYHPLTGQEKRSSIVVPDILLKPAYMSLTSHKVASPLICLMIVLALQCCRSKVVSAEKEKMNKMKSCFATVLDSFTFVVYIAFLPIYATCRSAVSISDGLHLLYSTWLWDLCIMLTVLMSFFTLLILGLLQQRFLQLWNKPV